MREYAFTTNLEELSVKGENGNILTENKINNFLITFKEKLDIGDIVKLKNRDYIVEVKYINYNIPNVGIVDYAGIKVDVPNEQLVLFNQRDIEYKIEQRKVSKNYIYYKIRIDYKTYFIKSIINVNDKRYKDLLRNELNIYKILSNVENIPKIVYSDIEKQGYIIYEYVKGTTLSKIKNLTLKERINILIKLCEILEMFHQNNIAHCDVKPSNILIKENGQLFLIDLGICTKFGEKCSYGSFEYCSVEQLNKTEVKQNFDIYSVGIIMFELIIGYNPFQNIKREVIMSYKNNLSLKIENLNISKELKLILHKATSNNIDKFSNIKEFKEELMKLQ